MRKHLILALAAVCVMTAAGCTGTDTGAGGSISGELSQTAVENSLQISKETTALSGAGNTDNVAKAESEEVIGEEEAKAAALMHADLKESEVTFLSVKLEKDDGRYVYDVEFYVGTKEYDYEIDAYSGEIVSYDYDIENYNAAKAGKNKTDSAKQNDVSLTLEEAKVIALEKAGVSEKDVVFTETSFEHDDGFACYQIDFISGTTEYEIEIDANSGEITEYDAEFVYD